MYKLYSMQLSANSYKVRLMLSWTGQPFKLVEVDVIAGESRTPEFLQRNPTGQVPLLVLPDGRHLPESGAILYFLAHGTPLLPEEPYARANVLRWMFFEQHSHEPAIATARFWLHLVKGGRELRTHEIDQWMERGYEALALMERHLASHRYFVGEHATVADLALYAHTHIAGEGEFDLGGFPHVLDWLARIAAEPGHIKMDEVPTGAIVTA